MRNNQRGLTHNRGRSGSRGSDGSNGLKAAGSGTDDSIPSRPKGQRRVLLYNLCSDAEQAVRSLDAGTRYAMEGKNYPIDHQLPNGATFSGFLRPHEYFDQMKGGAYQLSVLGQEGYERFYPLYNATDYAEALAEAQPQPAEA